MAIRLPVENEEIKAYDEIQTVEVNENTTKINENTTKIGSETSAGSILHRLGSIEDYDELQTTRLDGIVAEIALLKENPVTRVSSSLPPTNAPRVLTVSETYRDSDIISFRFKNANSVWVSGVGDSANTASFGIRVSMIGLTLTIYNNLTALTGNEVQVLLRKA